MPTIALALLVMVLVGCGTRTEGFFVQQATLADLSVHQTNIATLTQPNAALSKGFWLTGHHIQAGENLVIGIRNYSYGDLLTVDDENCEKITVVLGALASGTTHYDGDFSKSGLPLLFYSWGSAAFPEHSGACIGYATSGHIDVDQADAHHMDLSINATIEPVSDAGGTSTCNRTSFSYKARIESIELPALTYWEGKPAPSLLNESHRK